MSTAAPPIAVEYMSIGELSPAEYNPYNSIVPRNDGTSLLGGIFVSRWESLTGETAVRVRNGKDGKA